MFVSSLAMRSLIAQYFKFLLAFLVLTLFFVPLTGALCEEISQSYSALNEDSTQELYKAAKDYYGQLESNSSLRNERSNWLTGVRNFRRIYLGTTKSPYAPQSLFMMGRMHRRMYDYFHVPLDLENSINNFSEVANLYPDNTLADDALFNAAEGSLLHQEKETNAVGLFQKIVTTYPHGDMVSHALKRLEELRGADSNNQPGVEKSNKQPGHLVKVLPVKSWSSEDYTRIVMQTTEPVHFTTSLLEKNGDQPRRLYVDFQQSYIPPKFRDPVLIDDGLLKQVRTGQYTNDTVRVVLDIESINEYKVFSLNDPFRVIIDVHGKRKEALASSTKEKVPTVANGQPKVKSSVPSPSTTQKNEEQLLTLRDEKKKPVQSAPVKGITENPGKISLAQQLGLGVRKIVIDPGHGGKDPGAMAFGIKEKDIVLKLSKKIAELLKANYSYEVILTRTKDVFLPLEERTAFANTQKSDLFLSIHVNAHPDKTIGGVETYFLNLATDADAMRVAALENATSTHNISELQDILASLMQNSKIDESSRLARFIQTNLISGLGKKFNIRNLGVKQAPFYVLIGAEMPAVLAEISFITNPTEAKLLQDDRYLSKVAEQIAAGVAAYVQHHTSAALRL